MAVFRPIPDSLCASSSFLPYVGRFGQLVGRCHAIRVFFRLQKKGEGNRGGRKRKRPPLLFPLPLRLLFSLFANGLAPPPMPICQIYGASGGGTEKKEEEEREKVRVDPEQPSGKRYFLLYTFQRQFLMFLVEEERKMSISIFFFVFRSRRHRRDHFLRTRGTLARTL